MNLRVVIDDKKLSASERSRRFASRLGRTAIAHVGIGHCCLHYEGLRVEAVPRIICANHGVCQG